MSRPLTLLSQLGTLCETMGGSSGGIYSILLTTAAGAFAEKKTVEPGDWVAALRAGIEAVMRYGGAKPGDRTMVAIL